MSAADGDERLLAHLRRLTEEDARFTPPPPGVWDAIVAEVAHDVTRNRSRPDAESDGGPASFVQHKAARQRSQLSRRFAAVAAVAAAVVLLAVGLTPRPPAVDARADLAVLEDGLRPAVAELRGDVLRIAADLPATGDGRYEVWLLDEAVEQIVSLGLLRDDGLYPLPAGVDATVLPVVDISIEPEDGDPSHSGRSVLRGVLS